MSGRCGGKYPCGGGSTMLIDSPFHERFWSKVRKTKECWVWTACRTGFGYGQIRINRRAALAHRVSYEIAYGSIPQGLYVLHKCDNPPCVRPEHLWAGTHAQNMHDMFSKGRRTPFRKLSERDVREIRALNGIIPRKELGERFKVSAATISRVMGDQC